MLANSVSSTGVMEGVSDLYSHSSQSSSREPRVNLGATGTIPDQSSIFAFSAGQGVGDSPPDGDSVSGSERPGHSHQDCTEQEKGTTQGMRTHSSKDGGYRASEHLQKLLIICCERAGTTPYLS